MTIDKGQSINDKGQSINDNGQSINDNGQSTNDNERCTMDNVFRRYKHAPATTYDVRPRCILNQTFLFLGGSFQSIMDIFAFLRGFLIQTPDTGLPYSSHGNHMVPDAFVKI